MNVKIPPHIIRWLDQFYRGKATATLRISLKDGHTRYYAEEKVHAPPKDEWEGEEEVRDG